MVKTERRIQLSSDGMIGKCSVFEAKLWGILDGVTLVQGRQHDRVLVQADNLKVIGVIEEALSKGSYSAIIKCIIQLLQNEGN
ncbi:hypothetical protein PVK06_025776 [Gossypium arboreum]|uniref:RNase H type-1 domain-containing protein n=1 Tax=Gossypium arboreum TaxID=29729 RepID=A0ABR0NWZ1_GOSAR|nr:hypothetical protein PVK06_025776 [Gossypium arboreum]